MLILFQSQLLDKNVAKNLLTDKINSYPHAIPVNHNLGCQHGLETSSIKRSAPNGGATPVSQFCAVHRHDPPAKPTEVMTDDL